MEDQSFKSSFFGGFNKKSVVDYVTKVVNNYNLEIENLKKDYEKQLEQKDAEILSLSTNLKEREDDFKILESRLAELKNVGHKGADSKELEKKEAVIVELRKEIDDLKKASVRSKSDESKKLIEERFKKAQSLARERVNEIIEQARVKIAAEYRQKKEASEKEGKSIRNDALKEASKILNSSAVVARKIVSDSKDKIKVFVEMAKQEVKDLVDYATLVGQKIIKKSAEVVLSDKKSSVISKFNLNSEVEKAAGVVESNFKLDAELLDAAKKLNVDFLLGAGSGEVEGVKATQNEAAGFKDASVQSNLEG